MGIITAHSGCDGTEDNSLEFIRYALASEADCLEVDVRLDRDGELSLSHDETGEKTVKLQDAFALLAERPEKKMNCDLKLRGLEIPVYRLACRFHVEKQLIYSGGVDPVNLEEKKKEFADAEIFLNIENLYPEVYTEYEKEEWQEKLKQAIKTAGHLPVSCINAEYHILTDPVMAYAKEQGLGCSAWTVNEEQEMKRLLQAEIANITTRSLKMALQVKKEVERG